MNHENLPTEWVTLHASIVAGYDLERSSVMIHSALWRKIAKKHLESLSVALLHLKEAIASPHFVGQAPHHFENIEIIRRTPAGPLLVAIKIRNPRGFLVRPLVASAYLIEQIKVGNRLKNNTVMRVR